MPFWWPGCVLGAGVGVFFENSTACRCECLCALFLGVCLLGSALFGCAGVFWGVGALLVVWGLFFLLGFSFLVGEFDPGSGRTLVALLRQASAHCARFPTAASRRSLGRISVPVWPVTLSGRLPVVALVRHHRTNKLIGRELIQGRNHPSRDGTFPSSRKPQTTHIRY
jgi:hypothetical protein